MIFNHRDANANTDMKQYFITGTSSGIGKALAEKALADGHKVVGISRRHIIEHENYRHLSYDLSDLENYHLINFAVNKEAEEVILINNAGTLGDVKPVGRQDPKATERAYQINVVAPSIFCQLFISQLGSQRKKILNISSGAGQYPVPGWSTYCASKSAIDLFTQVLVKDHPELQAWAIAPGIVDTEMQGEIRKMEEENFPEVERFKEYKEKGELNSPREVADKLISVIDNPKKAPGIVFSIRDL